MNLALAICIVSAIIYLITDAVGKYAAVGELAKWAFGMALLAWLLGGR